MFEKLVKLVRISNPLGPRKGGSKVPFRGFRGKMQSRSEI